MEEAMQNWKEFAEGALGEPVPEHPQMMTLDQVVKYSSFIIEELMEMMDTVTCDPVSEIMRATLMAIDRERNKTAKRKRHDEYTSKLEILEAQIDAKVDIMYYTGDSAARNGMNLAPVFREVHKANMRKKWPDGNFKRENGKVVKPPGWKEPDNMPIVKNMIEKGSWASA